ncbi:uncharacterized protein EV154DRAFT_195997 [Mucor mucedo]|uniref:uncharacterized protein n=1 Tax=Mucor mucedo TaxID=29922 RepID=UPI0022201516|nr:uncharacterized protein EV154DRAFT_195997 [Mucor mucedo]KAI7892255.1 hypothetical protein EV154DRAFT_195997 [Mucor mucedo]
MYDVSVSDVIFMMMILLEVSQIITPSKHLPNTEEVLVLLTSVVLEDLDRVKFSITGNKVLSNLKINGLAPEVPWDLYHIIKNAVSIRVISIWNATNRKNKDSKYCLIQRNIDRIWI